MPRLLWVGQLGNMKVSGIQTWLHNCSYNPLIRTLDLQVGELWDCWISWILPRSSKDLSWVGSLNHKQNPICFQEPTLIKGFWKICRSLRKLAWAQGGGYTAAADTLAVPVVPLAIVPAAAPRLEWLHCGACRIVVQ